MVESFFHDHRTLLKVLAEEQSVVARECNADQTGPGKGGEDGEVVAGKAGDRRRTEESGRRSRAKSKKTLSTKPPKVSYTKKEMIIMPWCICRRRNTCSPPLPSNQN